MRQWTVSEFLDRLGSDAPSPGGGAAGALAASAGAALIEMVCRFTVGREAYAAFQQEVEQAIARAATSRTTLQAQMDADAAAFDTVSAAYKLPRSTREERQARRSAIDDALVAAVEPPLVVAETCSQLLMLALGLVGRTNQTLVGDLGAAGELLSAGLHIAALNVAENTHSLRDAVRAAALQQRFADSTTSTEATLHALRLAVQQSLAPAQ